MLKYFICFVLCLSSAAASTCGVCSAKDMSLTNNRYDGVVIAINPEVPEDPNLLTKLQDMWTEASHVLWTATEKRAYFGQVTILVPKTWTSGTYAAANGETYEKANIIVAGANPAFGDSPYTMQYGECGTSGEYIHLTPNYVISDGDVVENYGPKGKVIVHEWAHLRWGVYDESPTPGSDPFYYDMKQKMQATRCPVSLQGRNVIIDEETGEVSDCKYTADTNWLPEDGCIFLPFNEQDEKLNASLLSHQHRREVIGFCHDNPNDPTNMHNKEAPNEHNRLCNQRSVWDVMMTSSDFENGKNPPNPNIVNVNPTFKIVTPEIPRFVLVLDTSGSMGSGSRFNDMITSAKTFIDDFTTPGTAVGIVEFASSAYTRSELVVVHDNSDREHLKSLLPTSANGGTAIGSGILKAIEVLQKYSNPRDGHVIVLSDGEENGSPTVRDVNDEVCASGVFVDAIFFGGADINVDLQYLSEYSCGEWMANDFDALLQLMESFKALSETNNGDVNSKVFEVYGESFSMAANDATSGEVLIDSTIGKDTVFTITWSQYSPPSVFITDPKGQKYCSLSSPICSGSIVTIDTATKIMKFIVPGKAIAGPWWYEIRTDSHSQNINILVTTMAADPTVPPIIAKPTISTTDVASSKPLVINAKVTQGHDPIIGASVEATITCTADGSVTILELFDSGSAPDVRRNDGVYSRYFTGYSSAGRYSAKVTVTGMGNETTTFSKVSPASFNYGYANEDGSVVLNPNTVGRPGTEEQAGTSVKDVDPFRRIESAGGFSYSGQANTPTRDTFPPSKVIDLSVKQVDPLDATEGVVITFTSPGDDYDNGQAAFYEVRYTYDQPSILINSFLSGIEVTPSNLLSGDLNAPSVANLIEDIRVNLTNIPDDQELVTVAFALRATDDAGNKADVSNIAMMNLFLVPPPIACSDDKGNPISTDPFEKPDDCLHFYQCSNGELHILECRNDTVFNPEIGTCDFPENVISCGGTGGGGNGNGGNGNGGNGGNGTTVPTKPPAPPAPTCVDANGKHLSNAPFKNDADCTSFYQCSNGILYKFDCPAGLVFNAQKSYCDWPSEVPGC